MSPRTEPAGCRETPARHPRQAIAPTPSSYYCGSRRRAGSARGGRHETYALTDLRVPAHAPEKRTAEPVSSSTSAGDPLRYTSIPSLHSSSSLFLLQQPLCQLRQQPRALRVLAAAQRPRADQSLPLVQRHILHVEAAGLVKKRVVSGCAKATFSSTTLLAVR